MYIIVNDLLVLAVREYTVEQFVDLLCVNNVAIHLKQVQCIIDNASKHTYRKMSVSTNEKGNLK